MFPVRILIWPDERVPAGFYVSYSQNVSSLLSYLQSWRGASGPDPRTGSSNERLKWSGSVWTFTPTLWHTFIIIWLSGDLCEHFGSEQLRSSSTGAAVILDRVLTVRRPGPMKAGPVGACLRSSRWLIQWKKSHHASVTHMSTWSHLQEELCVWWVYWSSSSPAGDILYFHYCW